MELEGITLSVISQTEKDKYCVISHIQNLKKTKYNKLLNKRKKKQTHRYREKTNGYLPVGRRKGEGAIERSKLRNKISYKIYLQYEEHSKYIIKTVNGV